ncbi:MAG TPA: hypothetical protein VN577_04310 [Terriglobales bacterium]|nr:hypothetical protein [Terriglobales bacterium]
MRRVSASFLFTLLFVILKSVPATAGGPISVGGPTLGTEGQVIVWDQSAPVQYRIDGGPLGLLTNLGASTSVSNAFQQWTQVPGSALTTQNAGSIQGVADSDVSTVAEYDAVSASCDAGEQSPIIFDNGVLIGQLTGDSNVLGFSGTCKISAQGKIQTALTFLSQPSDMPTAYLQVEILHELGHFLGLEHTDVLAPFETGWTQTDIDNTPTMFYNLITPTSATLKPDDKAWFAKLYPGQNFSSYYGNISGDILFRDGITPVQGMLVIARRVGETHVTAFSSVSGYRFTNNIGQRYTSDYLPCVPASACSGGTWGDNPGSEFGSHSPTLAGRYDIPVLPGRYTIEVRSLSDSGSMGPFYPSAPIPGPEEYWETQESNADWDMFHSFNWLAQPGSVNVAAGQTVSGISIILNGTDETYDIFDSPPAQPASTSPAGAGR